MLPRLCSLRQKNAIPTIQYIHQSDATESTLKEGQTFLPRSAYDIHVRKKQPQAPCNAGSKKQDI